MHTSFLIIKLDISHNPVIGWSVNLMNPLEMGVFWSCECMGVCVSF